MAASDVTLFYNNFLVQELQPCQTGSWPSPNGMNMYPPTPSPSASSLSGHFSPTYSDEGEMSNGTLDRPYLRIVEQPVAGFRFRYRSEMQGAHGSLSGRKESSKKKTFPTVELVNFDGEAIIRCLLYTADEKPIPHMHQLIAKENSREVLDHEIVVSERNGYRAEFKGLGIVHMSKKDLKKELLRKKEIMLMEELKRDDDLSCLGDEMLKRVLKEKMPQLEKEAKIEAGKIDPNKVKLCFQAFCRGPLGQVFHVCEEIFSDTIQNMKSAETGELKICRMDRVAGCCSGKDEIFILVEKVCKKNIQVRFFELDDQNREIWSDIGLFTEHDVHHQYAIVFRTPPYKTTDIRESVVVKVELLRPKDGAKSEAISFTYKPLRRLAKRVHHAPSSSDSFSSFEGPKRCRPPGLGSDNDPMLSGSEASSFNSWNLPSDVILEAMKDIALTNDPSDLNDFTQFILSSDFSSYSKSFQEGVDAPVCQAAGEESDLNASFSQNIESPGLEAFVDLPLHHESGTWYVNSMPSSIRNLITRLGPKDGIVTDGAHHKKLRHETRDETEDDTDTLKHKVGTLGMAKAAYSKLLKLMKSRHPSRLQDMKNTIRAEDQEYGPLHAAVLHGQLKELSDLLSLIIKSNLLKLINTTNQRKQTPVMVAVEENNVECLKLLCMAKANLNQTDYKENTALHTALKLNRNDCLKVLLSDKPTNDSNGKIELDKKNERGETALHIAVTQKNLHGVRQLVAAGADVNLKTGTAGQTPLHLAVEFDSPEIVNYLLCQESIKPDEVNFNNKTAQDLINPNQKHMLSLFTKDSEPDDHMAHGDDGEDDDEEEEEDEDEDEDEADYEEVNDDEVSEKQEDEEDEFKDAEDTSASGDDEDENKLKIDLKDEDDKKVTHNKKNELENAEGGSKLAVKRKDGIQDSITGNFHLDQTTIDILAASLDANEKWKIVCKNLKCHFLVGTFSNVASPTRCLITYLEFEKKVSLSDLKDAIEKLNVPEAVKAIDRLLRSC